MPLAGTQSRGRLASRGGERGAWTGWGRWALSSATATAQAASILLAVQRESQAHAELEFKPWDPRGKSRHPSSAADSQSSGLCWDDQPRTVPSPEAQGHRQPPVKPPLKDTVSRALQTGQKSAASPHDLNGSFVAQMTDKCNN